MTALLECAQVTCGYGGTPLVTDVSFTLQPGQVCCVLGANGVGKTTLFKTLLGQLPLLGGTIALSGENIANLTPAQMARRVAYVPQAHTAPFPYSVLEVVEMGRAAHLPLASRPGSADRRLALQALNVLGIAPLANRVYTELSGGERQLVLIARALVQKAPLLVMDEPDSSLDYGNRLRVLDCARQLADAGYGVLMSTHTPDQALRHADLVVALYGGSEVQVGEPGQVITGEFMERAYGVAAQVAEVQTADRATHRVILPTVSAQCENVAQLPPDLLP